MAGSRRRADSVARGLLFLLYSHWGNIQSVYPMDAVLQLLWLPAFALLGASFIHLSLTYRPEVVGVGRAPNIRLDVLPYLPLVALSLYLGLFFIRGSVPTCLECCSIRLRRHRLPDQPGNWR